MDRGAWLAIVCSVSKRHDGTSAFSPFKQLEFKNVTYELRGKNHSTHNTHTKAVYVFILYILKKNKNKTKLPKVTIVL